MIEFEYVDIDDTNKCDSKPSKYSTARCEGSCDHIDVHAGRTKGGYWKFWECGKDE